MLIKILKSNLTRCFLFNFIYTAVLIWCLSQLGGLGAVAIMIYLLYPAPLYFAVYGGLRQGRYKDKHQWQLSSLIIMITWSIYSIIVAYIISYGDFGDISWRWIWAILGNGLIKAFWFLVGCMIVKFFQRSNNKIDKTKNN